MNAVERTEPGKVDLNGYKSIDRNALPAHWSDAFIRDLASRPGWIRYSYLDGPHSHKDEINDMMQEWSIWHGALLAALEILLAAEENVQQEYAVDGIRRAMQFMAEDLDDIMLFIRKTTGKWQEPTPPKKLRPVDSVETASA